MTIISMANVGKGAVSTEEWLTVLQSATKEVFSMMVGTDLEMVNQAAHEADGNTSEVTGSIGIAGAVSAVFSLRCGTSCATRIASRMLGVAAEAAAAHHCDAVGEICNMVAGQFKAKIGLEAECMLSVPTVVTGRKYKVHGPSATYRFEVPMLFDGEMMLVMLEVRL